MASPILHECGLIGIFYGGKHRQWYSVKWENIGYNYIQFDLNLFTNVLLKMINTWFGKLFFSSQNYINVVRFFPFHPTVSTNCKVAIMSSSKRQWVSFFRILNTFKPSIHSAAIAVYLWWFFCLFSLTNLKTLS